MNPTFSSGGDIVMVNKMNSFNAQKHQRGDVVMVKSPREPGNIVMKRITAVVCLFS